MTTVTQVRLPKKLVLAIIEAIGDEDSLEVDLTFARSLKRELENTEPVCDHSVGICCCETVGMMEDLVLAIDGLERCGECSGEGWVYIEEHREPCARWASEGMDCFDSHMVDCPKCHRKGVVAADQA